MCACLLNVKRHGEKLRGIWPSNICRIKIKINRSAYKCVFYVSFSVWSLVFVCVWYHLKVGWAHLLYFSHLKTLHMQLKYCAKHICPIFAQFLNRHLNTRTIRSKTASPPDWKLAAAGCWSTHKAEKNLNPVFIIRLTVFEWIWGEFFRQRQVHKQWNNTWDYVYAKINFCAKHWMIQWTVPHHGLASAVCYREQCYTVDVLKADCPSHLPVANREEIIWPTWN